MAIKKTLWHSAPCDWKCIRGPGRSPLFAVMFGDLSEIRCFIGQYLDDEDRKLNKLIISMSIRETSFYLQITDISGIPRQYCKVGNKSVSFLSPRATLPPGTTVNFFSSQQGLLRSGPHRIISGRVLSSGRCSPCQGHGLESTSFSGPLV